MSGMTPPDEVQGRLSQELSSSRNQYQRYSDRQPVVNGLTRRTTPFTSDESIASWADQLLAGGAHPEDVVAELNNMSQRQGINAAPIIDQINRSYMDSDGNYAARKPRSNTALEQKDSSQP